MGLAGAKSPQILGKLGSGHDNHMLKRHSKQKPSRQLNNWLILGIFIAFVIIIFGVFVIVMLYTRTNAPATPFPIEPTAQSIIIPTETVTFTPVPLQTSTILPSPTFQVYVVKQGDTLSSIAYAFGISVEALKSANALPSDLIYLDQQLFIPTNPSNPSSQTAIPAETLVADVPSNLIRYQVESGDTIESIANNKGVNPADLRAANSMIGDALLPGQFIAVPLESPVAFPPWKFSVIEGNFNQEYPLSFVTDRFTLHYRPGTFPAQDPNVLVQLEQNGLAFIESATGLYLGSNYDVYVSGTNFEPPNRLLRGITYSTYLKTFFLHDGTGNPDDQQYLATHELTHLFMWNTIGSPSSTMISEGTAVYLGMEMIRDSSHMPIEEFCAAYHQAGALPIVSASPTFLGHISDLQNYYAAGCFVKYLVNTYGIDSLKMVYHSGDYVSVYGKSLPSLESDWRNYLTTVPLPEELDPNELVDSVKDMENSYDTFFPNFTGSATQRDAYRVLDKARIALLQGNFSEMRNFLNAFKETR